VTNVAKLSLIKKILPTTKIDMRTKYNINDAGNKSDILRHSFQKFIKEMTLREGVSKQGDYWVFSPICQ
jgi:hypothetical protein